jgi:DNA primase large subunit
MDVHLLIPFCEDARKKTSKLNINVQNPDSEQISFIKTVLIKLFKGEFTFPEAAEKYLQDFFSFYPLARIVLSYINKDRFYDLFGRFYYDNIKKELKNTKEALDLLEIDYKQNANNFLIPFEIYIKAKIYSEKDKLTNQSLRNGFVYLTKEKTNHFIARYVGSRIIEGMPLDVSGTGKQFKILADELDTLFRPKVKKYDIKSTTIKFENFPPCMSKILATMIEHGNPSHMERYYFATFCFSIKMPFEQVLDLFKNTNDYDERIAKYQLLKVQKYSCPSCETIKSMGFSFPDEGCEGLKSPVGYYLRKTYNRDENKEEVKEE